MPDVKSIPFRQANGSGHYESKQLPNNNADFLAILGLPTAVGNVTSASPSSLDGQLATYWGTTGLVIKASAAIGIVDLVDGKVTTRLSPTGDIVGTLGAQTLNAKTLTNCVISGGVTGITKADVGLGNVDNTSDVNKPVSTAVQLALNLKENLANKNVANGYAGLDSGGKVLTSQLPSTVQGTVSYQGTWNANTNTPAIPAAAAGNKGWYYVVSVAGNVTISGVSSWGVGDWLVSNGAAWDKVDNTDAVASVAGKTGAVVLDRADVQLGNVDNTSDAAKNSAAATLTNKTISGASNSLTVRLDADVVNNLPVANLNNGIGANNQTWWCGDGQWKAPTGAGDVIGPAGAIDGEIALFGGATGKIIRRPVGTEIATQINPSVWAVRLRSYNAVGNPNFEIDQRNVGAGVVGIGAGGFVQDRWKVGKAGTMVLNSTQPVETVFAPGTNFAVSNNYQAITITTQQASLGANDYLYLRQIVEGSNMRELISDVHSMSLLVRSNVAPLKFGVAFRDGAATRSLCKLCNIPTANVWTLITLPNLPVWGAGGGWSVLPGVAGYEIIITLAAGANFTASSNDSWQTGNFQGAVGQDNFFAKPNGSAFHVAFVQHEPGSGCTSLMDCPWQQNYDDCLRYYSKSYPYATATGTVTFAGAIGNFIVAGAPAAFGGLQWPKRMAKTPSIGIYNPQTGAANVAYDGTSGTSFSVSVASVSETGLLQLSGSGMTAFHPLQIHYAADTGW